MQNFAEEMIRLAEKVRSNRSAAIRRKEKRIITREENQSRELVNDLFLKEKAKIRAAIKKAAPMGEKEVEVFSNGRAEFYPHEQKYPTVAISQVLFSMIKDYLENELKFRTRQQHRYDHGSELVLYVLLWRK